MPLSRRTLRKVLTDAEVFGALKMNILKLLLAGEPLKLETGVYILLLVLFFVLCCVAIFFLVRGIRRDRNRLLAEKYKVSQLDRVGLEKMLAHKYEIATADTHFCVMLLQVHDVERMKLSLGEKQLQKIFLTLKERLIRVIPRGSKICDYAPDMLAVYMEEDMDNKGMSTVASVAIFECTRPITLITRAKLTLSVNAGILVYNEFSPDSSSFMQNMELTLATAFRAGVNKYAIYSEELAETQTEEYRQYQEIKEAIAENQFVLYYQPIFDMDNDKVYAYEALVRWQHPSLGLLAPSSFLPIMEQTGDINWIGVWAFDNMLAMQTRHYKAHPENSELIFSLNLSPKQLMWPHLAEEFRKIYKKYKIPADRICFEIVEFSIFGKVEEVSSNILKLKQIGFRIAVDDFGMEMSSLKLLDETKFDWVKLDRQFVDKAQDDFLIGGVVSTLTGYSENSGFIVIAEGIEDEVTLKYVKGLKVKYGQGYYFGRPQLPENYNL